VIVTAVNVRTAACWVVAPYCMAGAYQRSDVLTAAFIRAMSKPRARNRFDTGTRRQNFGRSSEGIKEGSGEVKGANSRQAVCHGHPLLSSPGRSSLYPD
jgi:hypothetical protein